ncbi:Protein of unknown function DUF247 [Macleaya cordata]|uniref:Uncharacterized protein n=1 Tax=Macleaya cordata TaxID=56857 RepID=A0A200Q3S2_MACCD|nr:Protein of unknown function DUF247 [Macleaya cordata]
MQITTVVVVVVCMDKQGHRRPSSNKEIVPPVQERQYLIKCVTELSEAGAKFKSRSLESHDLLDIGFNDGALEIPPILVDVQTGQVFLNFIAYEQCDRYSEPYFTHYVLFMGSRLMNSSKDVELLHKKGIINHVLGSDADVADLFSKLSTELVHMISAISICLKLPLREVNKRYCTNWQKWKAKWISNNFSNPWVFSYFLAAVVLLLLTAIQTFFSIFSYVRPPS